MNSVLYIFITCKVRFDNCYDRIKTMMKDLNSDDFIIVKGGNHEDSYNSKDHILDLNCNDYYEGLPEKIVKTFRFIYNDSFFNKYTHLCKSDDDIIIKKLFKHSELFDYCGNVRNSYDGMRNWHIGKCSKTSLFNTMEYKGEYVPWCLGGFGYIVSKKIVEFIIQDSNYYNEIYEDVYIGKLLHRNNIFPINIKITDYLHSKDHF